MSKVRVWKIEYPSPTNRVFDSDITEYYTEPEILEKYFPYWSLKLKEQEREDLISEYDCIKDWTVVNWASKEEFERDSVCKWCGKSTKSNNIKFCCVQHERKYEEFKDL